MKNDSMNPTTKRRQTQWDGLFVSEHVWDANEDSVSDPQPMLSADEQRAIVDLLIVACERKCPVFIQSWQDRHFHFYRCTIRELDAKKRTVIYEDSYGDRQLAIHTITSVYMLD